MSNFQQEKKTVLDYYNALDKSEGNDITNVLKEYITEDYICLLYTSDAADE